MLEVSRFFFGKIRHQTKTSLLFENYILEHVLDNHVIDLIIQVF